MREHTKREAAHLLKCARSRKTEARDLRHGVLLSGNNDAPFGIDGNSSKCTAANEASAHGAVGSDLPHWLFASGLNVQD
jgi:hypothetical protein